MRVRAAKWNTGGVKDVADVKGFNYQFDVEQPLGSNTGEADFSGRRAMQLFLADNRIREGRDVFYKFYRAKDGSRRAFFAFADYRHATIFRLAFGGIALSSVQPVERIAP